MNKHAQSRAIILQSTRLLAKTGRRNAKNSEITDQDHAAAPPPVNLQVHPAGDCLIWLWNLNTDGYGTGFFPDKEKLAHRQAFAQSRGHQPDHNVLHLCHRPFCIQPSHLYDGSPKDNSQDRQIRTSQGLRMDLFTQKSEIVQAVAKYLWSFPPRAAQEALIITPAEHDCEFIVPAMDRHICPTCGHDNLSHHDVPYRGGVHQPPNDDPNVAHISRSSRSFRDISPGVTMQISSTTDYSIPRTKAERRRRDKEARKSPYRDKPRLLGSTRVRFKPGETTHFEMKMDDFQTPGPGIILLVAQPIDHHDGNPHSPSS